MIDFKDMMVSLGLDESSKEQRFIGEGLLKGRVNTCKPFIVNGHEIGTPFNLKDLIKTFGKNIIPDELGVYHLFYHDQLVYIGMSKSIRKRLIQHLRDEDMPFHNVLWFCASNWNEDGSKATIKDVLKFEYRLIKTFKPVLNSAIANCR